VTQSIAVREEVKRNSWFQQDGATAQTAKRTSFLHAFGDRIKGREVLHRHPQT
jgi:hypothetical protein